MVSSSPWRRTLGLVRPHRLRFAALLVFSFVTGVVEAGVLVIATRTALAITEGDDEITVVRSFVVSVRLALLVAAVLLVARLLAAWFQVRVEVSLTSRVLDEFRRRLAMAYLDASWSTQQAEPAGRLQQLVTDYANRGVDSVMALATIAGAGMSLIALLGVAVFVNALATVMVVVVLAILVAVMAPLRQRVRRRATRSRDSGRAFAGSVAELGTLGLEMQAFGVTGRFAEQLDRLISADARTRVSTERLRRFLPHIYLTLAFAALILALAIASGVDTTTLGSLGAVMLIMLRTLNYGQQIQTASANLMNAAPFLDDIDATIDRYAAMRASSGSATISSIESIDGCEVAFEYAPGNATLDGVTFRIERGEIIGIIGPSGAGKSTLVQLLLGVRDPTGGTIDVNGVSLPTIDRSSWAPLVGFVAQEPLLFTGTVADNLRFFRDGISDDTLERAARQANVLADIEALSDRFDTHLGERASQLSGGQRQRLSIARALAGRPELLILDEPTSALDTVSESLIRTTLESLRGEVTMVIIAHRMSTLDICDRIMVIEGGRLMAFDTPEQLRSNSDFYQQALALSGLS